MARTKTLLKKDRLSWQGIIDEASAGQIGVMSLFFLASALILPLCTQPVLSVLYLFGTLLFYYSVVHAFSMVASLAVPLLIVFVLTGSLPLTAAALGVLFGGVSGAFLLVQAKKRGALALIPVLLIAAAWGIAFLLTGDPLRGLLGLLVLPLTFVFGVAFLHCTAGPTVVTEGAGYLAAALTAAGAVTLAGTGHLVSLSTLADACRNFIAGQLRASNEAVKAQLGRTLLEETDILNSAAMFVNLLPGLLLAVCAIASFFSWRCFLRMTAAFLVMRRLPRRFSAFSMSPISAGLFLAAALLALFANFDGVTPAGTVAQNLMLVFEPGFAVIGVGSLMASGASHTCLSYLLLFGLVFLLFANPATALTLAAVCGAVAVLIGTFRPKLDQRKGGRL